MIIRNTVNTILKIIKNKKWLWLYIITLLFALPVTVFLAGQKHNKETFASPIPLVIDQQVATNQNSSSNQITSPAFTTTSSNELVVVFLASDGMTGVPQMFTSVTGGGLTFTLAGRANTQKGTSEVWYAYSDGVLTNAVITASRYSNPYRGMIRVMTFKGARTTLGAVQSASGTTGTPFVALTTSVDGSMILGAGNDPTRSITHTAGPNQQIVQQFLAKKSRQTFWVQKYMTSIPTAGTVINLNDTIPTTDAWNMVAVEVLPLPVETVTVTPSPTPVITSPIPTSGLTPTPSPTSSNWPDATNTGVPAGKSLTVVNGGMSITTDNTVIDGKDIRGCVDISATGVIIRNSKITCTSGLAVYSKDNIYSGSRVLVEDSEISCGNTAGTAVGEANITVRRANIHGCENGFDMNRDMVVEDSYIHDMYNSAEAHTDGIQLAGHCIHLPCSQGSDYVQGAINITITHNTIYSRGIDGSDGTSAIISNSGGDTNILIQNNLMAGGAYTLYCEQGTKGINYQVLNNHFSTIFHPTVASYGPSTDCSDEIQSGNVYHESGQSLTLE